MHPYISAFPSKEFYDSKLLDFKDKAKYEADFPAVWHELPTLGPITLFDVEHGSESADEFSYVNHTEADFCLTLYKTLAELYPHINWTNAIGVISPYDSQV